MKHKKSKQDISNLKIDGVSLPKNLQSSSNSSTRIIWMGPENWFIFSTKSLIPELENFNDQDFAITNLSHSRCIIEIEGDMIYEVLKKGSPLDINKLNEGDCANTVYNGITITIDFVSNNPKIIRILGLRSFGESLYHSITDACLEFGFKSI